MKLSDIPAGLAASALAALALAGCVNDAQVASRNLSQAADNFEINRRVVFYNGINGDYILTIEGRCSLDSGGLAKSITVTCRTGPSEYKKHYLGVSDNVTWFAEQMDSARASTYQYRVIFKPSVLIPSIEVR